MLYIYIYQDTNPYNKHRDVLHAGAAMAWRWPGAGDLGPYRARS